MIFMGLALVHFQKKIRHRLASYLLFYGPSATKVRCLYQCSKMQFITFQNFHIQTWFSQFLWFFTLKCWFKGQIISRICLILPNAYKLMCFDRNINRNFWSVIICFCSGTQTHFSNENYYNFLNVIISSGSMWSLHAWLEAITYRRD